MFALFHLNIQCIRSKMSELEAFLIDVSVVFDVVCLSEHWLDESEIECGARVGNWRVVAIYSRKTHIHGGVLIFARNELNFRPLVSIDALSTDIHCELTGTICKTRNIVIVCVYRSPVGDFNEFLDKLTQMLEILTIFDKVIIAGDFNVWFGTKNADSLQLIDLFSSFGYMGTVGEPTRGNNCLDNIFINFAKQNFEVKIYNNELSDHRGQGVFISLDSPDKVDYEVTLTRPMTSAGCVRFFAALEQRDFGFLVDTGLGANIKYQLFHEQFVSTFNDCFPQRRQALRVRDRGLHWFNDSLRHLRNDFKAACEMYTSFKTDNLLQLKKELRSRYRKAIRDEKMRASESYIVRSNNKQKAMWTF